MSFKFVMPKRWFNRLLVIVGMLGLISHALISCYFAFHGQQYSMPLVFTLLAPLGCLAWGLIPSLQLQKEQNTEQYLDC